MNPRYIAYRPIATGTAGRQQQDGRREDHVRAAEDLLPGRPAQFPVPAGREPPLRRGGEDGQPARGDDRPGAPVVPAAQQRQPGAGSSSSEAPA
jgi:hypothetical protein